MTHIRKLLPFVKPYWPLAILSLFLLTSVVFLDLAIPRLVQRIIDQGVNQQNTSIVIQTSVIMLGVSMLSIIFAIGNNYYSVQVGESVARDLREAVFLNIQSFSRDAVHVEHGASADHLRQPRHGDSPLGGRPGSHPWSGLDAAY